MNGGSEPLLVVETNPSPDDARFLEEQLYDFNVQATGIEDGALFGVFLRGPDARVIGGAYGWTWGGTCYVRYLFVPADMRGQGHGTRLMRAVEQEAMARGCEQMVVETHDFQSPAFYRKLGFAIVGAVEGYPRGHQYLTLRKPLGFRSVES
jgi:GNAT superfamily N-acetyltransferase